MQPKNVGVSSVFSSYFQNSIRHNLSLYDIFVREKSNAPGQTGTSYWTIRSDVSEKSIKGSIARACTSTPEVSSPVSGQQKLRNFTEDFHLDKDTFAPAVNLL